MDDRLAGGLDETGRDVGRNSDIDSARKIPPNAQIIRKALVTVHRLDITLKGNKVAICHPGRLSARRNS